MTQASPLSARDVYDSLPLGALVRFTDRAPRPQKLPRRIFVNAVGRLISKAPADHAASASFTLLLSPFGSDERNVVSSRHVCALGAHPFAYTVVEPPRPGQYAVLHDEGGAFTLLHLADSSADARAWLDRHHRPNIRTVPAAVPLPRVFIQVLVPDQQWLIVSHSDLAAAGMTPADLSTESRLCGERVALEGQRDMRTFFARLVERGIHARVRPLYLNPSPLLTWPTNPGRAA